jgi:arylformamidase
MPVPVFRNYDQTALDAQYEQRAWVPHADEIIKTFGTRSDAVRKALGEPRTEKYGPGAIETLDIYGEGRSAFMFIHGGAWKRQTKRENAFAAEWFVQRGVAFVVPDFALLPSVTLPEMAAQVCRSVEWTLKNYGEVVLCGHSSGGHLAGCALLKTVPKSALLVSGVYDLLPVRLSARNEYVRIDEKLEQEYSPIRHIDRIRCPVTVGWGEKEGAEFYRQSKEFAEKLKAPTVIGKGLNHFEVILTLADPGSPLAKAAAAML